MLAVLIPLILASVAGAASHKAGAGTGRHLEAVADRKPAPALIRKEAGAALADVPPVSLLHVEQRSGTQSGIASQAHAGSQQARFKVSANNSWAQLASWTNGNGGYLNVDGFKASTTHHAETLIRGMVASTNLAESTPLLHVPQKMWLHADSHPDVADVVLTTLPECAGKSRPSTDLIKLATVIAIELYKGSSSWYARYLRQLPTMAYYRTFHLHYAGDDILSSFSALPLTPLVRHLQKHDQELKTCFLAWQKNAEKVGGPLELQSLHWDEVELSMMHARNRAVNVGKGRRFAVVPGLDFFNTEGSAQRNVNWTVSDAGDAIDVRTAGAVDAKQELLTTYCEECDNSRLLLLWGVTLDGNRNPLDPSANRAFCSTSPAGSVGSSDAAVALKDLVASLLDVGGEGDARPRCLALQKPPKEAAKMQAPLRCSLALLALEYCAATWAAEMKLEQDVALGRGEFTELSKEPLFSGMTLREAADTVYASAIGAVHPFLLKSS